MIDSAILSENHYFGFAIQYCAEQLDEEVFRVKTGSRLDSLIRAGLSTGLWRAHETASDAADDMELIPPGGMPPPRDPATVESVSFDPGGSFISCSKVYTLQPALSRVWQRYALYHLASSKVKLCAMLDFFTEAEYTLGAVRHFIALDVLLQRMILVNGYSELVD